MDRASIREGRLRLWMETESGEVRYGCDLPACCRGSVFAGEFDCGECGLRWQKIEPVEEFEDQWPAEERRQRKGAA